MKRSIGLCNILIRFTTNCITSIYVSIGIITILTRTSDVVLIVIIYASTRQYYYDNKFNLKIVIQLYNLRDIIIVLL